jgi:hypothetical protein
LSRPSAGRPALAALLGISLLALALGSCDRWLRIRDPNAPEPIGRSCSTNTDCNDAGHPGFYCTGERFCDRDCVYDPASTAQLDCPAGCACSVLGKCATPEGNPCEDASGGLPMGGDQ